MQQMPLRIAIAAGEASGDQLAAQIITELKKQFPNCQIVGVAGEAMVRAGCQQVVDLQQLSVMGLIEIIKSIPRILYCRRKFLSYLNLFKPHLYLGVDAPDFNLPIEKKLKAQGVYTVHYNSPKVWAWRQYRVKKIKRAVDLMLTQFPFEADFYTPYQIPAKYVGHPFADVIQVIPKPIEQENYTIGLAMGSRESEIKRHGELFLKTAAMIYAKNPCCRFVVPLLNGARKKQFNLIYQQFNQLLPLEVHVGQFRDAIQITDCVLTAAGTATLEIMLLQKPMVVTYQLSPLTYAIGKRLVKVAHIALPNLIANKRLVPEFVQHEATPERLSNALFNWIDNPSKVQQVQQQFQAIQQQLAGNAAAKTVQYLKDYFPKIMEYCYDE